MDVDKHIRAEENIKLASMDLGRHCTDTEVYKWYVQKPWPLFAKLSSAVTSRGFF